MSQTHLPSDGSVQTSEKAADMEMKAPVAAPPAAADDIPDGGLVAWLQVLGGFFAIFNTWGIFNSYGAFQGYYEMNLLQNETPSNISWIGSFQGFLLLLFGALSGPIFDMGYFRSLLISGSFLIVFGMMMTSIATKYWQLILAQGVVVGMGNGLVFVPCIAVVATYFKRRRSTAVGIAMVGSAIGGVIYPAVFRQLQPKVGFGWATRVIGFIALGTSLISIAVMKRRGPPPSGRRALWSMAPWKEMPYTLFTIGNGLGFLGAYIPFFYITSYATDKTGASDKLSFYFVAILNAASVFGRLLPNVLADRTGPLNMLIPTSFAAGILALTWIRVHDVGGLAAFTVLYGFFSGTFVSLPPSAVASLTKDIKTVGTRLGMCFTVAGLALLIGTPIAGVLVNLETGDYVRAQIFCGVIVLGAASFITAARVAKVGFTIRAKA